MQRKKDVGYTVKGYWSKEGIFNGAIYFNNSKFGTVTRVRKDVINVVKSHLKDEEMKQYKRWLKENKLSNFKYVTEQIKIYEQNNPNKKFIIR